MEQNIVDGQRSIGEVKAFWENNPLFVGESTHEAGTKDYFLEHERVILTDCLPGEMNPILTKYLPESGDSRILDVGCGPGFWVRFFSKKGYKVTGCDLTKNATMMTKESLRLFSLESNVTIANAESLSYRDACFDYVNCQGVIHHTPNTRKCIGEFHRVLQKGGYAVFSVYFANFVLRNQLLTTIVSKLFHRFVKMKGRGREGMLSSGKAEEIVRLYDGFENPVGKCFGRKKILEWVEEAGFTCSEIDFFMFPKRMLPFSIPRWLHKILNNRFGLLICFACKK